MATTLMKWLETRPGDYDRGIRLLTLGRLRPLQEKLVRDFVKPGMRVLELGCGTGDLTALLAAQPVAVSALDASTTMLEHAQARADTRDVEFLQLDAILIAEQLATESLDLIIASLFFSELDGATRKNVLRACPRLLAPGGRLIILDEVIPRPRVARFLYRFVRGAALIITWLITQTTTRPLGNPKAEFSANGFSIGRSHTTLGGSLALYELIPTETVRPLSEPHPLVYRRTFLTLLQDVWSLFFRIVPPYPKVTPGLYSVGNPDQDSPVLVTGNYDLTVRRFIHGIDNRVNALVLVVDSAGINVWCGAGAGFFTAEKVLAALESCHLEQRLSHRTLILPQLCANGVDGNLIEEQTDWSVRWGPIRASDIPDYLNLGCQKTDAMRRIRFPIKDRLEMGTITLGFYSLVLLLPILLFWRTLFWPTLLSLLGLNYFYAILHPWIPGRDGLVKSIPMALIALTGTLCFSIIWNPLPAPDLFRRLVGITALSIFVSAEMQGMSPLMRGEQANWIGEGVMGVGLGIIYWLVPRLYGWTGS